MDLTVIFTWVACACCGFLCIVVIYLCVIVRRIRRDLNELSRSGNLVYTDANDNRKTKKTDDEYRRKRESSSAARYTIDPVKGKPSNRRSATHLDPEETVTYLTRPGEEPPATVSTFQEAGSSKEEIPLQFVNESFVPDSSYDYRESNSDSSSEVRCEPQPIYSNEVDEDKARSDPQPIYSNEVDEDETRCDPQPIYSNEVDEDEQAIYENNNNPIDEPVYLNRGELAAIHNPERSRLQTMAISDIA